MCAVCRGTIDPVCEKTAHRTHMTPRARVEFTRTRDGLPHRDGGWYPPFGTRDPHPAMKKLLPSVTLAFASLAALTGFATAGGSFGLFTGCHCCKSCGGTITLRQYNAFSPVACGSMMFQGCVVAPPPQPPAYGGDFGGGFGGDCADGSCGGETVGRLPNG